jgi:hypothetical protein
LRVVTEVPVFIAALCVAAVPFAGVYGGTAGAGSVLGWDRSGGENPAVLGGPGWTFAVAGYAPFGLEDLRLTEATAAWDHERWGVSASYRGMFAPGEDRNGEAAGAGIGVQSVMKLPIGIGGLTTGIEGVYQAEPGNEGAEARWGLLWRPRPWGTLGGFWSARETQWGRYARGGIGVDGGFRFSGMAWRLGAEALRARARWETRFAAGVHPHALLALYLGWDPPRRTAALGVRFGIGGWEGFSAMRRHAALGGTSVQGIRWRNARVAAP